jgi:hypothetical protein
MAVELRIKMESEDDVKMLRRLADTFEQELGTGEAPEHQEPWSEGPFIQFWSGLPGSNWQGLKPDAKRALREISKRPDAYPADELLDVLGISGAKLGGNLSSVGFGMKYFRDFEWPLHRNWDRNIYEMPPEVAEIIQKRGL